VLESEVLYELLRAIKEKRLVGLSLFVRQKERNSTVFPLRIYISTRNGRQYLLAHSPETKQLCSFRLDNIKSVRTLEKAETTEEYERQYEAARNRIWGTSLGDREHTEHLEMVISIGRGEDFIL
jgi:predicted DNA-binding transcriptional regulator YafY